ncbi:M23 family peptidase [Leptospira sp. 96542]|nr:M23 family peptidase [Leptospira sp. 96542]
MGKRNCIFLLAILSPLHLFGDPKFTEIPSSEVGFPLPYISPVSGTFAEIRNHNLHLGSDFKSYGLNGHNILATFDGYVEEISYSKLGYGLSLNLYNPKYKIKSKYAHLHSFGGILNDLELLRRALLLMGEPEGFHLKLPASLFSAKKGMPLGKTGETGSGISHLHLEFRTDKGIVNPLYFSDIHQKDLVPPTILSFLIDGETLTRPILLTAKETGVGKYDLFYENGDKLETISLEGKLRFRISGYDLIRSRNKNNVYGMDLIQNGKTVFSRNFDFIGYEDRTQKHQYYDINRSTFAPPVYFYHLYEQTKNFKEEGFSIDTNSLKPGESVKIQANLRDASANVSQVQFTLVRGKNNTNQNHEPKTSISRGRVYTSQDKNLTLDLSKAEISGDGSLYIEEMKDSNLPFTAPKNLPLKGKVYQISSKNLSWKGEGLGEFRTNFPITQKEFLYFYDASIGKFQSILHKKKQTGFSFKLTRLGYIFILLDETPPTIFPMTSLARYIELPEIRNQCLEDRYYGLGDIGSGFRTNVETTLDGQNYPYEYDPDRKAIRIQIPKSLAKERPYLLLEVRVYDFAGNKSEPFVDLVSTNGWLSENQASCPVIE